MNELQIALKEYLSLRRALGFKLQHAGTYLPDFVSFLERQNASYIRTELALRWAVQPTDVQPSYWAERLRMVRLFAQYRSATDPRTEIPPNGLLPYHYRRKQPHIYRDDEITQLLKAAKELPSATGLRSETYSTLFGLLAVTGMRVSEVVNLDNEDVDLAQGVLTIRGTKFGKSRLIPVHVSTQCVLRRYACQRDRIRPKRNSPSFFVSEAGRRLSHWVLRLTFIRLSRQIGLRGPSDSHGPRLHDFRHAFAVRALLNWYRAGLNVEQHMPELSTYLGHVHVTGTYWYLSATPELLRLAAMRLDRTKGGL